MVGMVGCHKVVGYSGAQQFSRLNGPQGGLIAPKLSQKLIYVAKSMTYIINQ